MGPLLAFIAMIITLYIWVIIISAILSWLIAFDVVNRRNRVVYMIADSFYRLTEPALRPIRKRIPDLGGLDISPVILILGLIFLRDVVIYGWIAPNVL
ncbi:MAG: YggT family protein [Rhodomicrobium sp.]